MFQAESNDFMPRQYAMRRSGLAFSCSLLLLSGCQSYVPLDIRTAPVYGASLLEVREHPERYKGRPVRWGGTIVAVENRADGTWVEIVEKYLDRDGRPAATDVSPGRFIATWPGFLDPAVYHSDRKVTVSGVVEGSIGRPIGAQPYRYPLIKARNVYLWTDYHYPEYPYYPYYRYYPDPFWYGPFYGPYWHDPFWSWRRPYRLWRRHH
ncbi:MAG: Slp family lipoprotein [Gammaproteobacteria bacterium]